MLKSFRRCHVNIKQGRKTSLILVLFFAFFQLFPGESPRNLRFWKEHKFNIALLAFLAIEQYVFLGNAERQRDCQQGN